MMSWMRQSLRLPLSGDILSMEREDSSMSDVPASEPHNGLVCAFCRIISGEETASIVFEDSISLAFLDRRPLFPGHCLLIPKQHVVTLADLPAPLVGPLFQNAQLLEQAIEEGLPADGTFVAINNRVSQSVPHLHIHLVPRHRDDGLRGFFWPRQRYKDEAAERQVQETLRAAIARIRSS
jgi:histidine triad (HIT) family protein